MPARLTAYVPDHDACVSVVHPGDVATIGRADDAALHLPHPSVSRRHAEVRWTAGAWTVADVGSKNGTWVDGRRVESARLERAAWMRFGDVYCELVPISEETAAREATRAGGRGALATTLTLHLQRSPSFDVLLRRSLDAAMALAHCDRGLVALSGDHDARLHAAAGFALDERGPAVDAGCFAALEQVLATRAARVEHHPDGAPWEAGRDGTTAPSLRIALPLIEDGESVGALYVDRREAGDPLTGFDRALLDALAQRVARAVLAHRATGDAMPEPVGDWRHAAMPALRTG